MKHVVLSVWGTLMLISACVCPLRASGQATVTLTGTVRDFNDTHPDFEHALGDDRGIVGSLLGSDGRPVYASKTTTKTTHGKFYFDQWFNDTPGVNMSAPLSLTLTETSPGSGLFDYASSQFFPIDGQLLGNQGRPHNYHFTYALPCQFTYRGGEKLTFRGDDDLWVFINDNLAVDLGGVHPAESASLDLDAMASTLGIVKGNSYSFDLFFAERHTVDSNFHLQTSIALEPNHDVPEPGAFAFGAAALLGLGVLRFRRRLS